MKITRLSVLLLTLLTVISVYGMKRNLPVFAKNLGSGPTADADVAKLNEAIAKARLEHRAVEVGPRPHGDGVLDGALALRSTYPRPISAWQTNEKAFYTQLLEQEKYDVLVVPFQVQDRALDQATRSLLTARLTGLIQTAGNLRIPDPYLVARALGDGDRRFKSETAYGLAQHLNVSRIIWGYVGHNSHQHLAVTLTVQDKMPNTELTAQTQLVIHSKEALAFSNNGGKKSGRCRCGKPDEISL